MNTPFSNAWNRGTNEQTEDECKLYALSVTLTTKSMCEMKNESEI